ncbi:MAG: bis(5'-nucleosyl)-tetraphosphatase (symmetrical) YqeK [Bacilli bacterium]|nr:bis(5'-nucleosyl)-tetraphosphatase (symmetrical) YqeK [Bacilli bacterium]
MINMEIIKKDLQLIMSKDRYEHSLLVADEAKKLAEHYNLNQEEAYLTGLIHDIAKEFNAEENERIVLQYKLPKELLDEENKKIIHAEVGALYVKEKYNFNSAISNAIKYHTIGNKDMTDFDKIIFIADKIGRKATNETIEKIKEVAYENLDKAMLLCIKATEEKLASKGKMLHPDTVKLLNKLQKNL